jgi:Lrp/AsnC family leucine-responsive transcriptional regulator
VDNIDLKILTTLVNDGRASVEVVAEQVGLSPTPVRRRIKQLEKVGVIRGYRADFDLEKCGLKLAVYLFVKLKDREFKTTSNFEARILGLSEIQHCDLITGAHDYILTLHVPSMAVYNNFLRTILSGLPGVFSIETSIVIGRVKDAPNLPIVA